jgi:hypothetical protein
VEGSQIPPWTAPVPPSPSQSHPPGALPPALLTLGGGKLFSLYPTLSLSETWTDNWNQTATHRLTNYRTTVGPGINLLINGPSTKGSLSGNAGLTYDTADRSGEIKVFPSGTAALQQVLSPRLSLTLTDTYVRSDNPTQADPFGLNTQRQTFTSNSFSAAINYLIDRVATQGYYRNSIFWLDGGNGSHTTSNVFGVTASSLIGANNTAQVGYEFSLSDTSGASSGSNSGQTSVNLFTGSVNNSGHTTGNLFTASLSRQTGQYSSAGISSSYQLISQSNNDTQIWNVSLFSTYGLASGLSMSGSLGYSWLIPDQGSSTSGISSNTSVSYRFAQAVISVGIFSDFRQTALEGQNFGIVQTQGFTGLLLYTFTPFIIGSLQGSYTTNSFTGIGNSSSSPDTNTLTGTATLNWQLLRWLSMQGQYIYLLRSTSGGSLTTSGNVSVNTAIVSLNATF